MAATSSSFGQDESPRDYDDAYKGPPPLQITSARSNPFSSPGMCTSVTTTRGSRPSSSIASALSAVGDGINCVLEYLRGHLTAGSLVVDNHDFHRIFRLPNGADDAEFLEIFQLRTINANW